MAASFQQRRRKLIVAAGLACAAGPLRAGESWPEIPALSTLLGQRALRSGRIAIEIPKLADNGNSVPLSIKVESPMTNSDRVVAIHVFSERNPRPRIAAIELGPDAGRAELTTRIRLAGTQHVVAVAVMSDGTLWGASEEVIVTQSACTDDT